MEAIIVIVGFLGAGKTTLLKDLIASYDDAGWQPFVILNDYENAEIEAQQLTTNNDPSWVQALSGSCICCSGITQLRDSVNRVPERPNGVTLIEANGTSDACSLMGFLGVGIDARFLPPIQISVVDVKNWQQRGDYNDLEENQVQLSSLIVLTHLDKVSKERRAEVVEHVTEINPYARIVTKQDLDALLLTELTPSTNTASKIDHQKTHWASCSVDIPALPSVSCVYDICQNIPESIVRVKGCAQIQGGDDYMYFERIPDGEVIVRPFRGEPATGAKLLTVGPGSDPVHLQDIIKKAIADSA